MKTQYSTVVAGVLSSCALVTGSWALGASRHAWAGTVNRIVAVVNGQHASRPYRLRIARPDLEVPVRRA